LEEVLLAEGGKGKEGDEFWGEEAWGGDPEVLTEVRLD